MDENVLYHSVEAIKMTSTVVPKLNPLPAPERYCISWDSKKVNLEVDKNKPKCKLFDPTWPHNNYSIALVCSATPILYFNQNRKFSENDVNSGLR